jgi:triosephosphate isomerase
MAMRSPLIAANWKMNTTLSGAAALVREMRDSLDMIKSVDKVLCPPFISIAAVCELVKSTSIKVGAQNMYFQPKAPLRVRYPL